MGPYDKLHTICSCVTVHVFRSHVVLTLLHFASLSCVRLTHSVCLVAVAFAYKCSSAQWHALDQCRCMSSIALLPNIQCKQFIILLQYVFASTCFVICSGWTQFADWGKLSTINNLAGSISWFFGMALWITSFSLVRRHWYQVRVLPHLEITYSWSSSLRLLKHMRIC